jgi:isopentenyldiphosphate isomerase
MERSATPLFGVVTYGVHMTAFIRDPSDTSGLKIWVPRRSLTKQTYPGMLDNTVAGGMTTGETPGECVIREAMEEASLPEEVVRAGARACGVVTYFYVRGGRAGGETDLLQPEVEYIYDLELDPSVVPQPCDSEVEDFRLWNVEEVQEALGKGMFKPNSAIVLIDFFIRHGITTPENEENYLDIVARLHRRFEFPTP